MAFCGNCGAALEDDVKVCGACGAPVDDEPIVEAAPEAQPEIEEPVVEAAEVETEAAEGYDPKDIEQNKIVAAIANFPILFWIPFVTCKDSKFAMDNANHGVLFLAISIVLGIISAIFGIITTICYFISETVGHVAAAISGLVGVVVGIIGFVAFAVMVVCIIFALIAKPGEVKEIPIIGKYLEKVRLLDRIRKLIKK